MSYDYWIAVDWGTSRLRAFRMSGDRAMEERSSDDGMGSLERDGFEPALLRLVDDWLDGSTDIVACGMVGSRQGWVEAPYTAVPAPPLTDAMVRPDTADPRLRVRVVPGLKQTDPADVMRGEETQIAGVLAANPRFDGVLCLPGTHSKWAQISAGEVVSFRTVMTGELYAVLSRHTVLRHTLHGDGWDEAAFDAAVSDALSRPEALSVRLFGLRAEALLKGLDAAAAKSRLSGLLLGAELAALRPYWLGQDVALVGEKALTGHYARALSAQGVSATRVDATTATLAGLSKARDLVTGDTT